MIASIRRTPFDREILRLAVPALGALAADPLVSLIDTAFVGRLGATALAGVAIASAVFAVAFSVFNFLEYAVTPMVASAVGAGDREAAGAVAGAAFVTAASSGVVAAAVLLLAADPILRAFGAEPAVLDEASAYLAVRLFALPAVLTVMVGHGVFRGFQDTRTPLLVTLGLNLVNLVLDPILIFGLGWGVVGAATATVVAQWIGAVSFLALIFGWRKAELGTRLGRMTKAVVRPLLGAGGKLILRNASLLAAITVSTAMAARTGTAEVAAHQIALQVWVFLALVLDALAIAGQAMVGKAMGARAVGDARAVSNRLLALGVAFGMVLSVGLTAIGFWIGTWFTHDEAVVSALGTIYAFVVLAQPLNGLVFVWDGIAIGASAFGMLAWSTFAAAVTAAVVMVVGRNAGLGLVAVWLGMTALMIVRAAIQVWWYQTGPLAAGRGPSLVSPGA